MENFAEEFPMSKALAKLSRKNHQRHVVDVMPLIAGVFGVQCYLMGRLQMSVNAGDLALYLALSLISFVAGLLWYDKSHHILIYHDRIEWGFSGLGSVKTLRFDQVGEISAPSEEKNFSTLIVSSKDGKKYKFFFVDFPVASKAFIEKQIACFHESNDDDQLIAA